MSKKYAEKAAREGRAALLPEWLQEGHTVWIWRETRCLDDELCIDMVGPSCPMNRLSATGRGSPEVRRCRRMHPVLDAMEIWSAAARFTPRGVIWVLNDAMEISDVWLRKAVFPSKQAALTHRPEVIEYG